MQALWTQGMPWLARVNYVVDGDSIWVRPDGGGTRVRLRIDGVDAPEICQTFGPESRQALQQLALNQRVRVTGLNKAVWPDPPSYHERKKREEENALKAKSAERQRPRPHRKTEDGTKDSK